MLPLNKMGEINYSLICPSCGHEMRANSACPQCGKRYFTQDINAQMVVMAAGLVAHKPGATEAIRVSDSPRSVTADLSVDDVLRLTVVARRRQNEQANREVCQILVERLNKDGMRWLKILNPKASGDPEQGIDSILVDADEKRLNVQITRALQDPSFWRLINPFKPTTSAVNLGEYVQHLKCAIEKKSLLASRSEIVLALDAIETGHAFLRVADSFKNQYGAWVRRTGFKAVWLVGPTADLTHQLDADAPTC